MELAGETERRDHEFARRFLQTAVVVDDEAYMATDRNAGPKGAVVAPSRARWLRVRKIKSRWVEDLNTPERTVGY